MPLDFSSLPDAKPADEKPSTDYTEHFVDAGVENDVDPNLLRAYADVESGPNHNRWAISPAGAQGVMQLMPETAVGLGVDRPFEAKQNIHGGAKYIREQMDRFKDPYIAAMAYNAGPHGNFANPDVQAYADKVMSRWDYYRQQQQQQVQPGAAQPAVPAAPAAAPGPPPLIIGDSLAMPDGLGGEGMKGAGPKAIYDSIKGTPEDRIKGRDVWLSSGASNDTAHVDLVKDQIKELQGRGARNVVLFGVGTRPDYVEKNINDKLTGIANATGAKFVPLPGDQLQSDGVHPNPTGYQKLKVDAATAVKAQLDFNALPNQPPGKLDFNTLPDLPAGKGGLPLAKTDEGAVAKPGQPAVPAQPEAEPGYGGVVAQAFGKGLSEGVTGVQQAAEGPFKDRPAVPEDTSYVGQLLRKPISEGWRDPKWWIANIVHGGAASAPSLTAAGIGTAAGTATAGPWGGLIGGAAGFGLGSAIQELVPAYQRARAEGLDHDAAVDRAMTETKLAGAWGTAMGLVPGVSFFGRAAEGALKRPISEALAQIFVAQPALGVGQQVTTGAVEGRTPSADEIATGAVTQMGLGAALTGVHAAIPGRRAAPAEERPPAPPPAPPPADTPEARALRDLERQARGEPPAGDETTVPSPPSTAPPPPAPTSGLPLLDQPPGERAPPAEQRPTPPVTRLEPELTVEPTIAQQRAEEAKNDPPIPPGMTRLYHGSATHGRYEGDAWFSTDRRYARDYREGAELQYVDMPTEWVNERADPDGYGQGPAQGFTWNAELSSDITGPRRPIGTLAQESIRGVKPVEEPPKVTSAEPPPVEAKPTPEVSPPAEAETPSPAPRSGDIVNLTPDQLTLDPQRFQYKAADEKGVTGALVGGSRWEPDLANPITVWQDKDGTNYVVNGHQRTDLARRAEAAGQEDVQVPARIYRETDGYTPEYMRRLGAFQNIAEGSGTVVDAARVLRGNAVPDSRRLPDLPPRSDLVRGAQSLAKLSPEAFGLVENDMVKPAYASFVGDAISDPKQQMAALDVLMKHEPANEAQARMMVNDIRNAEFTTETQTGLFGDEEFSKSLIPERAKVLDRATKQITGTRRVFKAAVEGEETLTGAGNVLNPEANVAARTQNERIIDILRRDASTKGPVSDALTTAARALADGQPIAAVTSRFLSDVRQIERGGQGARLGPGDVERGADTARPEEAGPGLALEAGGRRRQIVPGQADIFGAPTPEAAPLRRQAEPTIRNDPRQETMPGMGPSAVQQQAARDQAGRGALAPRVPQEPAGGLFAPRETPQPELPGTQPAALPSPAAARFLSKGTDETAQIPAHTPETAHSTAANLVFDLGRDDMKEHLALVDLTTGEVVHASTDGERNRVTVMLLDPDSLPAKSTVFHHNHPDESPPSPTDLAMAGSVPSVSHVVVEAHDGRVYTIATTDKFERAVAGKSNPERGAEMDRLSAEAREYARKRLQQLVNARIVTVWQANAAHLDVANRALAAGGWVDYVSGYPLPKVIVDALRQDFGRIGRSAADVADLTRSVFADEAIASLPKGMGRPSGDQGRPIGGAPGRGGEARAGPAQGTLLEAGEARPEDRDRVPLQEERLSLFEQPPAKDLFRAPPAIVEANEGLREETRKVSDSIATGLVPMRSGSTRAQAFATTFANGLRRVMFRYGTIDRAIRSEFNAASRAKMGSSLDRQSVFEQQIRDLPPDQQAAQRAAFDAGGTGLAGLNPRERATVEALEDRSKQLWERYQRLGMVSPNAVRIPYYFSRQVLVHSEELGFSAPGRGGGAGQGIDRRGSNLTTRGPMRREYLTPEETEAAAQAKFGPSAHVLTDIRSLVQRLSDGERAAHGVELMNAIDYVGRETGVNLVVRGDIPGMLTPGEFFTMADHPAFRRWTGNGWQAVHVAKEFEGPLRAVLRQESPAWYNAAMKLKGGIMNSIMFSPFIHLAVEIGRSLPVVPGRMLTLQVFRDGSRLRNNAEYMDTAIRDGLAPLGQGWHSDPVSIADQARLEATSLGAVPSALQGVRAVGKFMHETLLWDNIFKLQVGLYDAMKTRMMAKGLDEASAGTVAAHIANRYAGALPPEHLSKSANMAANLLLFSRSFTLGNLGVIKDMLTGAPQHVLARINQMTGPEAAKSAQSALRRKAISAFTLDIGLFYVANAALQTGLQIMRQAPAAGGLQPAAQQVFDQWWKDSVASVQGAKDNPLGIFGVLPQHWNEPGKENRVYAGLDSTGRGTYLRLPPGKVGEEFLGWFGKPGVMLENKLSPPVRAIIESIVGSDTLGRKLYQPNPETVSDYLAIAGAIVQHIGTSALPLQTIQGAADLYHHYVEGKPSKGDPYVSAAKVLGPATGLATISSGFPGGPEAGEVYAWNQRQTAQQQAAMPGIRDKILTGDTKGAVEDMQKLKMKTPEINAILRLTTTPGPSRGQEKKFQTTATPEVLQRVEHHRAVAGAP